MNLRELKDKFSVKELDEVKISTLNEEYTGIILPSANEKTLPIKLKSGYNIGVGTERITGIQKLGEAIKETPAEEKKIMKIDGLPSITIINTGGTIASRVDYRTGAVSPAIEQEKLITNIPELMEIANIETKMISEMFSEDMNFFHYKKIAEETEKTIKEKNTKGKIIGNGTDTKQ